MLECCLDFISAGSNPIVLAKFSVGPSMLQPFKCAHSNTFCRLKGSGSPVIIYITGGPGTSKMSRCVEES